MIDPMSASPAASHSVRLRFDVTATLVTEPQGQPIEEARLERIKEICAEWPS
jgi:hypothetical protein